MSSEPWSLQTDMSRVYTYKLTGWSTTCQNDDMFVDSLRKAAYFLPGSESMSNQDYMDNYAKRAWNLGHVIRSYESDVFVFDLIRSGLLEKTEVFH